MPNFAEGSKWTMCSSPLLNKGPWLREWIEYHHMIGARNFILYKSGWSDNTDQVLAPYIERGMVEVLQAD